MLPKNYKDVQRILISIVDNIHTFIDILVKMFVIALEINKNPFIFEIKCKT